MRVKFGSYTNMSLFLDDVEHHGEYFQELDIDPDTYSVEWKIDIPFLVELASELGADVEW